MHEAALTSTRLIVSDSLSSSLFTPAGAGEHDSDADCMEAARKLLRDDCIAALKFCLDWSKRFHKARHRLARTYEAEGDLERATEEMRHLFQKGRRLFGVFVDTLNDEDGEVGCHCCNSKHVSSNLTLDVKCFEASEGNEQRQCLPQAMIKALSLHAATSNVDLFDSLIFLRQSWLWLQMQKQSYCLLPLISKT